MNKHRIQALSSLLALLVLSNAVPNAFAHQRALYTIGDKDYLIIVGSLNEPIYVDDRTGVDLRVLTPDPNDPMNSFAPNAKPVEGLEKTLKVEISAGGKKTTMDLSPVFRDPGHYYAIFYPTVATTYSYRIFGTINNVPVDLTFTCATAGEAGTSADNSIVKISDGVTRKGLTGGFGCPKIRSDAGFPEPYTSNAEIGSVLKQIQGDLSSIKTSLSNSNIITTTNGSNMFSIVGIGTGIVGIGLAIGAIVIARKNSKYSRNQSG